MSRRDDLHFPLRRTLEKDGWIITSDPLILVLGQTLFQKPIFQIAIQRSKINLLIYAPEQEVIIQWITH